MRFTEVKCPRLHHWTLAQLHHELPAQFFNVALSAFAAINILWGDFTVFKTFLTCTAEFESSEQHSMYHDLQMKTVSFLDN